MDEPLSNLDAKLRVGMRASLSELHARLGVTTIYVTHDQTEAMTLGERVAVMRDGRVVQVAEPQVLYAQPRDLFVAAFIGSPSMNLVEATVDGASIRFGGHVVPLEATRRPARSGPVVLGVRPEAFEDAAFADPSAPRLRVQVDVLEELGADTHVCFRVDARRPRPGLGTDTEDVSLLADETTLFTARIDPRTQARQGEAIELAVDPSGLHFFDAEDGSALLSYAPKHETADRTPLAMVDEWS
jgi:multiple sugar transport system ATP-binding protein